VREREREREREMRIGWDGIGWDGMGWDEWVENARRKSLENL
jgi:hypothetical protein